MKTKEQIIEWLNKQPWKNEFYENHFKYELAPIQYDKEFISSAFMWGATPQGSGFWRDVKNEYIKWYNSDRPMSWEEYCEQNPIRDDEYVIDTNNGVFPLKIKTTRSSVSDVTVMSKELCEAFVAYMKLIQLRNVWMKGGEEAETECRIEAVNNEVTVRRNAGVSFRGLSFVSLDMANEFMETFKDLLEIAKPLL